jgi:hypothetical protein
MEVAKVDKSSATIRYSTDKAKSPPQGRRSETMMRRQTVEECKSNNDQGLTIGNQQAAGYAPRNTKW